MKKITVLSLAFLAALSANAIDKQTYAEIPSSFPEAFSLQVQRYDYRGVDDAGDPMLVNVQPVEILWEPEYMNGSACYGRLTVENFFSHDWVQQPASVEFTNENNLNFMWNEDGTQCTFSFTGYFFSMAQTGAEYANAYGKLSKYALLARAKKGNTNNYSRYWLDGAGSWYAYNGGMALDCVLNLADQTLTISQPWGAFMCADQHGAPSSYVIEYYESSGGDIHTATAISDVKTNNEPVGDGYYYNLAGQRVTNPTPGFYIHNGKKVIVR